MEAVRESGSVTLVINFGARLTKLHYNRKLQLGFRSGS